MLTRSLLLLGVVGIVFIHAQTCDYYDQEVQNCNKYVLNGTLYIPPGSSRSQQITTGNQAVNGAQLTGEPCRTLLSRFSCGGILRNCYSFEVYGAGNYSTYYRPVCKSLCQALVDSCSSIISSNGRPIPDCNQIDNVTGLELYPTDGLNITLYNSTEIYIPCNDVEALTNDSTVNCVYPTTSADGGCYVICPDPMYSDTEYLIAKVLNYTPAWISFIMILVTFGTFVIDKNRRRWPHSIPYWWALSMEGLMFGFVMSSLGHGGKDIWCAGPATASTQENNSACAFQGFVLVYTVYAVSLWLLAFDVVVLHKLITLRDLGYQKVFQIFCWVSPLVPAIAVAAKGKLGYQSGGLFCLMTLEIGSDDPTYYLSSMIMYPTTVLLGLSALGIFAIVYFINEIRKKSMSERVKELNLKVELSMLAFLIVMVCLTLPSYIRFFVGVEQRSDVQAAYKEWIQCALSGASDCHLSKRPSFGLLLVYCVTAGCSGAAGVLVLGLHQDALRFWKPRIIYWVTGVSPEAQTSATLPTISLEDLESRSRFSINLNEEEERS